MNEIEIIQIDSSRNLVNWVLRVISLMIWHGSRVCMISSVVLLLGKIFRIHGGSKLALAARCHGKRQKERIKSQVPLVSELMMDKKELWYGEKGTGDFFFRQVMAFRKTLRCEDEVAFYHPGRIGKAMNEKGTIWVTLCRVLPHCISVWVPYQNYEALLSRAMTDCVLSWFRRSITNEDLLAELG